MRTRAAELQVVPLEIGVSVARRERSRRNYDSPRDDQQLNWHSSVEQALAVFDVLVDE
jgi:hypothetical protein